MNKTMKVYLIDHELQESIDVEVDYEYQVKHTLYLIC